MGRWCLAFLFLLTLPASAGSNSKWFESVKDRSGFSCCDISDGHLTEDAIRDGFYWVPINGVWVKIPPDKIITEFGNPTGSAVVWYVFIDGALYIRCFVPGAGL